VLSCDFRYKFIRSRGSWKFSIYRTQLVIVAVFAVCVIMFIPNYMLAGLETEFVPSLNATVYRIKSLKIYLGYSTTMNTINVWLFILVGKLVPCSLMCIIGCLLLRSIRESAHLGVSLSLSSYSKRMKAHRRTTIMLLAIMMMFLISELPAALLVLVSVFVKDFFRDYYMLFADTLDIVSLANNAINFVMFCIMSKQFRDILRDMVKHFKFSNILSTIAQTRNGPISQV